MRYVYPLILGMFACAPRYAQNFVGEWTISSGVSSDTCPAPSPSGQLTHRPGDTTLTIAETNNDGLSIKMAFPAPMGGSSPACEFTAVASSESSADLQAKACALGSARLDILEGSLRLTPSGALEVDYSATVGEKVICKRLESATFVPK